MNDASLTLTKIKLSEPILVEVEGGTIEIFDNNLNDVYQNAVKVKKEFDDAKSSFESLNWKIFFLAIVAALLGTILALFFILAIGVAPKTYFLFLFIFIVISLFPLRMRLKKKYQEKYQDAKSGYDNCKDILDQLLEYLELRYKAVEESYKKLQLVGDAITLEIALKRFKPYENFHRNFNFRKKDIEKMLAGIELF